MSVRIIPLLAWLAAASFLASWFLPVLQDVPGWLAFRYALAPLVPYGEAGGQAGGDSVPQVLSALTNVLFGVLFGQWLTGQMFRPSLFVKLALLSLVANLYWLVMAWRSDELSKLLYGYYLWLLAFALLLAVAVLTAFASRRTSRTPTAGTP